MRLAHLVKLNAERRVHHDDRFFNLHEENKYIDQLSENGNERRVDVGHR